MLLICERQLTQSLANGLVEFRKTRTQIFAETNT